MRSALLRGERISRVIEPYSCSEWDRCISICSSDSLVDALGQVATYGVGGVQLFVKDMPTKADILTAKHMIVENEIAVTIHASVRTNLAKPGNWYYTKRGLQDNLNLASLIGAKVVQHCGKGELDTVKTRLSELTIHPNAHLLMENDAYKHKAEWLGGDLETLNEVIEGIDNTGLCFDTQHAFASGYRMDQTETMKDAFKWLGDRCEVVHLNDSKVRCASSCDRHEVIGEGYIWSENTDSLKWSIEHCRMERIPAVIELTQNSQIEASLTNIRRLFKSVDET